MPICNSSTRQQDQEWLFSEEIGKEETEFILMNTKGELNQYSMIPITLNKYLEK
jgi:hypothetical protein